ncbi:androglobin [Macrotis lagotis]|uniref:androglobin n=1 Tax=Macrotis lagotis TaxID=92651 RepID=UPI003D695BDB
MTSKQGKKKELHRINSTHVFEKSKDQSSFGSSTQSGLTEIRRGKFPIWPEWNEADINAEKWDGGKGGKEKDKSGKSPILHLFDDPEGKIEMPSSLKVFSWKRPQEILMNKTPVVVKNETSFDLFAVSGHILCSEVMRWIVSEIHSVWKIHNENNFGCPTDPPVLNWKPWEHIYSLCKAVKGHMPLYNSYGKYVVKLYWMGCWRKITVDDTLPFDEENRLLLPATTLEIELWPMILAKAIVKLTNVDIHLAEQRELGEFTVLHALTGWLPEVIPLRQGYLDKMWELLKEVLPEFKLTEDNSSENLSDSKLKDGKNSKDGKDSKDEKNLKDGKEEKGGKNGKEEKGGKNGKEEKSGKNGKEEKGGKESKTESAQGKGTEKSEKSGKEKVDIKEGKKKVEKEKARISRPPSDAQHSLQHSLQSIIDLGLGGGIQPFAQQVPQMVIYATFTPLNLFEKKIFTLEKMADSAEKLREYGLCHIRSHPVLVTQTRSCPLVSPPKPLPVPAWKLIRQKKETVVTDEPQDPVIKKPERFLEIASPFFTYKTNPISIPTETHYVQSVVRKGAQFIGLPSLAEVDESQSIQDMSQTTGTLPNVSQVNLGVANGTSKEEPADNNGAVRQTEAPDLSQLALTLDKSQEEVTAESVSICKEIWIDYDDFCRCFQNIYVFHKPNSYIYTYQKADFKSTDDRVVYYLFVDSLKPIELLVCFSALVRWGESGAIQKDSPIIEPGLLTVETSSWKSLTQRNLVLKIHTYAVKAAMIHLPVGRHMLIFTANSPVGHHIHLCSMVSFIFGEEDVVMPYFEKESLRFIEHAVTILKALGNVMNNFRDKEKLAVAMKVLQKAHCPSKLNDKELMGQHFKVFNLSLWRLLKKVFGPRAPTNFRFAFRALTFDFSSLENFPEEGSLAEWVATKYAAVLEDKMYSLEELTTAAIKLQAYWRGCYVRLIMKARKPDTNENNNVAETLQKLWSLLDVNLEQYAVSLLRLMFKSKCKSFELYPCYQDEETKLAFADYSVTYSDQPPHSWFIVFREIFYVAHDMLLVPKVYTSLPVCLLHVVNNDTMEEVPRVFLKVIPYVYTKNKKGYSFVAEAYTSDFYVTAGKWRLRIIGSFTPLPILSRDVICNLYSIREMKEYYLPNEKKIMFRYSLKVTLGTIVTIQVQTSKTDAFIKLQILENEEEAVSTIGKGYALIPTFYFHGNEKNLSSQSSRHVLSHNMPAKKEADVSQTKKKAVAGPQKVNRTRTGGTIESGQSIFDDDSGSFPNIDENSQASQQTYKYIIQASVLYNSWPLSESQVAFVQTLKDLEKFDFREEHKVFLKKRKGYAEYAHSEKHEELISVGFTDAHGSTDGQKTLSSIKTTRKGKEKGSDKAEKEKLTKEKISSKVESQSQQQDPNKPYWTLRLVTEQMESDILEIKKDTERADEIRAMKQAWESAEPGRSIKAAQARINFINKFAKKSETETESEDLNKNLEEGETRMPGADSLPNIMSPEILATPSVKRELEPLDLTPYIRKTNDEPVLYSTNLAQQQEMQKAEEVHQFRQYREIVLNKRDNEFAARKRLKSKVLDTYGDIRTSLQETQEMILLPREEYRESLLEEERRQEALAAEEATVKQEQAKKNIDYLKKKKRKRREKKGTIGSQTISLFRKRKLF